MSYSETYHEFAENDYTKYNKTVYYYHDNNHIDNILSIFPGYIDSNLSIKHTDVFEFEMNIDHHFDHSANYHVYMHTDNAGYDDNLFIFKPHHGSYDNLHYEISGGNNEGYAGKTNYSYTKGGNPHRDFKLQHIDIVNNFNADHHGLNEENVNKFTDNYFNGNISYADGKYMEINWTEHYECNTHNRWQDHYTRYDHSHHSEHHDHSDSD